MKIMIKQNSKKHYLVILVLLFTFIIQNTFSQTAWGSNTGTNSDNYIINDDKSNNFSSLRLQTSNNRAWTMVNMGNLSWNYSPISDFNNFGVQRMKLNSNGTLGLVTDQQGAPHIQLNDGFSISTVFKNNTVVFRNMNELRFTDENAWDFNKWGGLVYKSAEKKLVIGGAKSSYFTHGTTTAPEDIDVIFDGVRGVGIGTTDPGNYKLAVEGTIGARGIDVKVGAWSDFVFEKDYTLKSLEEVAIFIEKNKHLPDVPSEAEVLEKGIDLAKMDAILLQKIEELTLYMIDLRKRTKN